jgi:hypothetical protein
MSLNKRAFLIWKEIVMEVRARDGQGQAGIFKVRLGRDTGERQRDRETERQRDRETERQRDRETERQRDRETKKQRDIDIIRDNNFTLSVPLDIPFN